MTVSDCKEYYDREWQRREQLQSAAGTPISVLTLVGGGLLLMEKAFESHDRVLFWSFWAGAAAAAACLAAAIYFIIRSLHGYEYERIPYAADLAAYQEKLRVFYAAQGRPGRTAAAFDAYISTRYIEASDRNAKNNLLRGEYLHRGTRFLVYGLCATAVAAVPAGIVAKRQPPVVQSVRVTNLRSDAHDLIGEWRGLRPDTSRAGTTGEPGAQATGGAGQHQAPHRP